MPIEKARELAAIARPFSLQQGGYFIREGEIPKKLAFVRSGLFRFVYINERGQEFTKGIMQEQSFISSYSAMVSQSPSHFYIEALEDSKIFEITYENWLKLYHDDVFWVKFALKLVEKGFIKKEKRERSLLLFDAETRYHNFLEEHPGLEKRIPQHIIASYLGIQPESLSRIRKKIHS
ncbi:Crp/Fnr family transcriptional regulator [Flagellimonas sp.]|uniref:Crp/Fnr family transcriptional regulator n=1 Tax=Flagellimonas sp. TaxID=2058762 RepID=UPI003BAF75C9